MTITIQKPDGTGVQAQVGALADCYWSAAEPDHPFGRIGESSLWNSSSRGSTSITR